MNFDSLIQSIADIHKRSHASATKAVNMALTARNWLIGAYIHEYELRGEDRDAPPKPYQELSYRGKRFL